VFDNNATECENHYPADALGEMAQDEPEDLGFILVDEIFKTKGQLIDIRCLREYCEVVS
jgi:hypothetical protein